MGSKKKYKINKQTTYLLLYYQEINMVHKQNKEKKNERTLLTLTHKTPNAAIFSLTTPHTHTLKQNLTLTHTNT